jgi:hypothetical protein
MRPRRWRAVLDVHVVEREPANSLRHQSVGQALCHAVTSKLQVSFSSMSVSTGTMTGIGSVCEAVISLGSVVSGADPWVLGLRRPVGQTTAVPLMPAASAVPLPFAHFHACCNVMSTPTNGPGFPPL